MNLGDFAQLVDVTLRSPSDDRSDRPMGLFVDILFRSADHDKAGFCELLNTLSDLTGLSVGHALLDFERCEGNWDPTVFGTVLEEWFSAWQQRERVKLQRIGLDPASGRYTPENDAAATLREMAYLGTTQHLVLSSGPRNYLNARAGYARDCLLIDDPSGASCHRLRTEFLSEAERWPGVAMLDLVSTVVPVAIGADKGRGIHLTVDSALHASAPWLIAEHVLGRETGVYGFPVDADSQSTVAASSTVTLPADQLYTRWGNTIDPDQRNTLNFECDGSTATTAPIKSKVRDWLWLLIDTVLPPSESAKTNRRCPFHLTVHQADLSGRHLSLGDYLNLAKDRFVYFGVSMARFADTIDSPIHGEIAGMFNHMMATDNLLQYKNEYYRLKPQDALPRFILSEPGRFSVMWFAFFVLMMAKQALKERYRRNLRSLTTGFVWIVVAAHIVYAGLWWRHRYDPGLFADNLLLLVYLFFIFALPILWWGQRTSPLVYRYVRVYDQTHHRVKKDNASTRIRIGFFDKCFAVFVISAPHAITLLILLCVIVVLSALFSVSNEVAPFDSLSVFYAILPVYALLFRNELTSGVNLLTRDEDVINLIAP